MASGPAKTVRDHLHAAIKALDRAIAEIAAVRQLPHIEELNLQLGDALHAVHEARRTLGV